MRDVVAGYVRGANGTNGKNGDGYTAATINANGDLVLTRVTYDAYGEALVTDVNLGHVVGASDYEALSNKPMRGLIIGGIFLVVFNLIAFLVPFPRIGTFWVGYVFGVIAILAQAPIWMLAFRGAESARS